MTVFKQKKSTPKSTPKSKTQVYNVVILDCSGSMCTIRQAALSGFNETLQTIRSAQKKYADSQDHFVTLVSFNSDGVRTFYDMVPVREAKEMKLRDYEPNGGTPLYDAMGHTILHTSHKVDALDDATVFVTVITDGMENCSVEFDGRTIRRLVEKERARGWSFTYMGANQNAEEVAMNLSIRNARNFDYNDAGTRESMERDSSTRMNFFSRLYRLKKMEEEQGVCMESESRRRCYANLADEAFDEEEGK